MSIDESIFPQRCWLAFLDDGTMSPFGKMFMGLQRLSEWQGKEAEHPCYGCRNDDCDVRVVQYHDDTNRYFLRPKRLINSFH